MTGERTEQALARIEAALGRITAATQRTHSALAAEEQRTAQLRRAISETIRDLDRLIAGEDPA